tara:strand:- start:11196 stop:11369 length:174 start_codon:yes stop_codon:yes gene_type:complete
VGYKTFLMGYSGKSKLFYGKTKIMEFAGPFSIDPDHLLCRQRKNDKGATDFQIGLSA